MVRNTRCTNLRLINSIFTTFSLTRPEVSLLASNKTGTPMRLLVSNFSSPTFRYWAQYAMIALLSSFLPRCFLSE